MLFNCQKYHLTAHQIAGLGSLSEALLLGKVRNNAQGGQKEISVPTMLGRFLKTAAEMECVLRDATILQLQ